MKNWPTILIAALSAGITAAGAAGVIPAVVAATVVSVLGTLGTFIAHGMPQRAP